MNGIARAALAGWATGDRSFSATSVLLNSDPAGVPALLRRPLARRGAALAAVGELVGDKLPNAPARTTPQALVPRLVLAGLCGAALSRSAAGTFAAVTTAAAAAFSGPPVRAALARRFGSDLPGALAEDAAAYGLAYAAVRT